MTEQEFKQLKVTDQVSCNGILGLVLENSGDEVRIAFDGDRGSVAISKRDLEFHSSLRVVCKAPGIHHGPRQRAVFTR